MPKQENLSRRERAAAQRSSQQNAERRRNFMTAGVVGVVALLIVGAAAWPMIDDYRNEQKFKNRNLSSIGAKASVCQDITTAKAEGEQVHLDPSEKIDYPDSPPAFGKHYNTWESISRKFYSAKDRPDLGFLVHNLEHGYTILWYDETAAKDDDMMATVKALSSKFNGADSDYRNKFKAVPWLSTDGKAFPEGQHIALTHWSVGGTKSTGADSQVGATQYCSEPSGAALDTFMRKYPYTDSPEPNAI